MKGTKKLNPVVAKVLESSPDKLSLYTAKASRLGFLATCEQMADGRIRLLTVAKATHSNNKLRIDIIGGSKDECVTRSIDAMKKHGNITITLE